jgi:hypothetical protein
MTIGYKRRKRAIKAGTYETPWQRHIRVMRQFNESVERLVREISVKDMQPATAEKGQRE